jgi:hypothetical protein
MNKTTEEIKLEILSIAREDLMYRFNQLLETFRVTAGENNKEALFEAQFELIRDGYPTAEEIKERAEALYLFVAGGEVISQ